MTNKRKGNHGRRHHSHDQSTASHVKRRRISDNASEIVLNLQNEEGQHNNEIEEGEEWTVVRTKSTKSQNRGNAYPHLRIHQNYQGEVRLKDLRDLSLYLLADEIAPKWTAIANSNNVCKVVTVMIPGMDEPLLRRAQQLTKNGQNLVTQNGATDQQLAYPDLGQQTPDVGSESRTGSDQKFSWLFDHVLQVKGPGDSKMSKVHSPLQALLLSQEVDKNNPTRSGHAAERTPISAFVHSADELRDAEFPIHPATFTAQLDAELEVIRRAQSGQSSQHGWVDSAVTSSQPQADSTSSDFISEGLSIYSVDCEMVQTSDGKNSLARVSIVSYPKRDVVLDKYVKPDLPIVNYFTQFSGITPKILVDVTTTLQDVQQDLLQLLTPATVLLGHSLDSDLNALKMTHPFLVDTSLIYPHPRGLPLRSSLKFLANKYLKREIQAGGANGHDSVEDASAVLDLVKLKCERGPKWGTIEANGEPIFRRLKRNGRTSAMVEYGTPERGYGKDATHTIGCQNDAEITKGIIRAIKGDNFYDFELPAGGVDFVWGRLRALEFARGWVNGPQQSHNADGVTGEPPLSEKEVSKQKSEELDMLAVTTVQSLQEIHDALPAKALLIVCCGTSDIRPVMQLQAQQQQYRKEFKVKKWDDLTIKWTDVEEQALRKACDNARAGWGVCAIK